MIQIVLPKEPFSFVKAILSSDNHNDLAERVQGAQDDSPSGLWEKLRVPRGKRKAGAARQVEARGF